METVKKKIAKLKYSREKAILEADEHEVELAEKIIKAEELEAKLVLFNKELSDLEDNLDAAESKMISLIEKLHDSDKKIHENSQAQKLLENRKNNDDDYTTKMKNELAELNERNAEFEGKIDNLFKEIQLSEVKIDEDEERAETLEHRAKELEMQMTNSGNTLRSLQLSEIEASGRNTMVDKKIDEITAKLKEMNARADEFESKSADIDKTTDEKEIELAKVKEYYMHSRIEFDGLIAEIGEM